MRSPFKIYTLFRRSSKIILDAVECNEIAHRYWAQYKKIKNINEE